VKDVEAYGCRDKTAKTTSNNLKQHLLKVGHIENIRSDQGTEFLSSFSSELVKNGISHRRTSRYSPHQNGGTEVNNRTCAHGMILLLKTAKLSPRYWFMALQAFLFVLNRVPRDIVPIPPDCIQKKISSFECRYGHPSKSKFHIFGCLCFYRSELYHRKLETKWQRARFLGWASDSPSFVVQDLENDKIYHSRHVIFREDQVPADDNSSTNPELKTDFLYNVTEPIQSNHTGSTEVSPEKAEVLVCNCAVKPADSNESDQDKTTKVAKKVQFANWHHHRKYYGDYDNGYYTRSWMKKTIFESRRKNPFPRIARRETTSAAQRYRQSLLDKIDECYRANSSCDNIDSSDDVSHLFLTQSQIAQAMNGIIDQRNHAYSMSPSPSLPTPVPQEVDVTERVNNIFGAVTNRDREYANSVVDYSYIKTEFILPVTYKLDDALDSSKDDFDQWQNAMKAEDKQVSSSYIRVRLEDVPRNCRPLPSRYVLVIKNSGRYKARIVVIGYLQYDSNSSYAPVAKLQTFRILCSLAAEYDEDLESTDIDCAFIRARLPPGSKIYVLPPRGHPDYQSGYCWLLTHSLYGLKCAARCWHQEISKTLLGGNFVNCALDRCLFVYNGPEGKLMLTIYVDDILLCGKPAVIAWAKRFLSSHYPCKDLGPTTEYLGIRIVRNRDKRTIELDQSEYISRLLIKYKMDGCKNTALPLENKLVAAGSPSDPDYPIDYRSCIGAINYVACYTGPDLSFPMSSFSKYVAPEKTTFEHQCALKHFLRYISNRKDAKMVYKPLNTTTNSTSKSPFRCVVSAYVDSDWAGDPDSGRSTQGYVVLVNGNIVSWISQLQDFVATSTTEAEYCAFSECCKDVEFTRNILSEFIFVHMYPSESLDISPSSVKEDNEGAVHLTNGAVGSGRTKKIKTAYHYGRDLQEKSVVKIEKEDGTENCADPLTKPLKNFKEAARLWSKINFYPTGEVQYS